MTFKVFDYESFVFVFKGLEGFTFGKPFQDLRSNRSRLAGRDQRGRFFRSKLSVLSYRRDSSSMIIQTRRSLSYPIRLNTVLP
jgi:hypothetical protein